MKMKLLGNDLKSWRFVTLLLPSYSSTSLTYFPQFTYKLIVKVSFRYFITFHFFPDDPYQGWTEFPSIFAVLQKLIGFEQVSSTLKLSPICLMKYRQVLKRNSVVFSISLLFENFFILKMRFSTFQCFLYFIYPWSYQQALRDKGPSTD